MSTQQIINPYDGSVVGEVPLASEADVREAIAKATAVRQTMAEMPAHERARILERTAVLIENQHGELARLMARESGKPLRYAKGEVSRCVETFTFAADAARSLHGETVPMDAAKGGVGKIGYYIREPVGVVGAITPFNFPLNLVAHKVAPAIAAGCPIVLKPAPTTPLTAVRLAELTAEAGLPEGAFSVVVGDADVGKWLTTDPRVAMLSFTGSPGVAEKISEVAGLRRTAFELGGNAGTIIDEGTELTDALIDRLLVGSFAYSGQVCISVQRIYVHESLYPAFKERFVAKAKQLKLGDPLAQETEIGPLITDTAGDRIEAWLAEAEEMGAAVLAGGQREGRMFQPTVLENVTKEMKVMCAEVFGPVVNILPYSDYEQALADVDDSEFGLQAGVYTPNLKKAMLAVQRLNVGGVMINDVPTFRIDNMPYGGNKKSGVGREGPQFAIEDMTTLKMVVINP
ncbi:MAG: aldehyde dehydrogenase family protein [Anaerolineales bacterium]|nr:aldehyde dehydrogenase family protein [Anaerolineales bacterium]